MTARTAHLIHLVFLIAWFVIAIQLWPSLPDQIPIHFGASGQPDAWTTNSTFSWLGLPMLAAGLAVLMAGFSGLVSGNPDLVNVPDKDRFLRLPAERRAAVIGRFVRVLALTGLLCSIVLAAVHVGVYQSAMGNSSGLPWYSSLVMGLAIVAILAMAILENRAAGADIERWSEG